MNITLLYVSYKFEKWLKKKESVGVPLVPRKCQRGNVGTVDCILSPAAAAQQRVINGTI